jgi:SAM-dependent methyltransferase
MNERGNAEFDRYAKDYTEVHRINVSASGEEPSYFSRYKAQYMARNLEHAIVRRPLSVLDFGCGVGNSIPHLREAFPNAALHGVDPSGESIRVANETHVDKAAFRVNGGSVIPYEDRCFDLVQVACVFHHVQPEQRKHWMQEIHRVLKPGGMVFVFEHNVLNPLTVRAVRDCPFDEDATLLPRRELSGLMHASGFTRIRARYIVFFPAILAFLRPLEPLLGMVPFGAQYVVRATA